jgi:hypothetical protein
VTRAADDSAVAAMNCRRESFLRDMVFPLCLLLVFLHFLFLFFLFLLVVIGFHAIAELVGVPREIFGSAMRTELNASVEK